MGLTQEQALALLGTVKKGTTKDQVSTGGLSLIEQRLGPYESSSRNTKHVTWHDTEMRCANKSGIRSLACGSPTYIKVRNIPKCQIHAIFDLANLLDPKEELEGEL